MTFRQLSMTGFVTLISATMFDPPGGAAIAGQTCRDSAGQSPCQGTNSPCVCVERADLNSPGPVHLTDFSVDFSDSSNPDITFKTGHGTNNWRVWSQVHASNTAPHNLGDLRIDSTGTTDIYKVEIKNSNNNPGAVNLLSAVLKDTTSWTGHSSIASGSVISGNLAGNTEVAAGVFGDIPEADVVPRVQGRLQPRSTLPSHPRIKIRKRLSASPSSTRASFTYQ